MNNSIKLRQALAYTLLCAFTFKTPHLQAMSRNQTIAGISVATITSVLSGAIYTAYNESQLIQAQQRVETIKSSVTNKADILRNILELETLSAEETQAWILKKYRTNLNMYQRENDALHTTQELLSKEIQQLIAEHTTWKNTWFNNKKWHTLYQEASCALPQAEEFTRALNECLCKHTLYKPLIKMQSKLLEIEKLQKIIAKYKQYHINNSCSIAPLLPEIRQQFTEIHSVIACQKTIKELHRQLINTTQDIYALGDTHLLQSMLDQADLRRQELFELNTCIISSDEFKKEQSSEEYKQEMARQTAAQQEANRISNSQLEAQRIAISLETSKLEALRKENYLREEQNRLLLNHIHCRAEIETLKKNHHLEIGRRKSLEKALLKSETELTRITAELARVRAQLNRPSAPPTTQQYNQRPPAHNPAWEPGAPAPQPNRPPPQNPNWEPGTPGQ